MSGDGFLIVSHSQHFSLRQLYQRMRYHAPVPTRRGVISTRHSKIPTPVKDGSTPETTNATAFHALADLVLCHCDPKQGKVLETRAKRSSSEMPAYSEHQTLRSFDGDQYWSLRTNSASSHACLRVLGI